MRFKVVLQEYEDKKINCIAILKETNFKRALSSTCYQMFRGYWTSGYTLWECSLFDCVDKLFAL